VASYNNSDGAWYLQGGFANPYGIPLGGLLPYVGASAPNSAFVLPFGQAISRTTYATLFALTGSTFGTGDGSTTFNVLDLRGRSVFGLDNMGGSAASRVTNGNSGIVGTTLGAAGGDERLHQHNHAITDPTHAHAGAFAPGVNVAAGGAAFGDASNAGHSTGSSGTGITINNAGSGASQNMPPAMMLPYILRVI
jgi:microcystin-dependent protein